MELIIAFWIVLAIVVAWAANARGRDASQPQSGGRESRRVLPRPSICSTAKASEVDAS